VHALVDGCGLPLVLLLTTGQAGDSPALPVLLSQLRVPRAGAGRPRTTPDALLGDKAYSAKAHRDALRSRGVKVVIPEKTDQQANRKNKGQRGGRPVTFDAEQYKDRNVIERGFNKLKNWRGLATRYDKLALVYRGGLVLASIVLWLNA
jgi:transposase